jgi:hypothetical protein
MAATVTAHPSSATTTTTTAPSAKFSIPTIPPNVSTGIAYLCNTDANRSVMCWYDNASVSQDGVTLPQATDPVGPSDSDVTWEGQPVRGLIMNSESPTDFTCNIGVNAPEAAFQSQVGTASLLLLPSPGQPATTSYFADFNCFKDNGRVLYTDGNFGKVYSIYYCLFANSFHGTG